MNKKAVGIIGVVLAIVGISVCFGVSIFFKEDDYLVKLERGGVCNPLNPVTDKEVKISDKEKSTIRKYWDDIDFDKLKEATNLCDCVVGDYKLYVDDKIILFNVDLDYVSIDSKYLDIDKEFLDYIQDLVVENDDNYEEKVVEETTKTPEFSNEECCSCCPDAEPGETCIDACCACS